MLTLFESKENAILKNKILFILFLNNDIVMNSNLLNIFFKNNSYVF